MIILKKFFLFTLLCTISTSLLALGYVNGRVSKIRVYQPDNIAVVEFDREIAGNTPGCVSEAHRNTLALDPSSASGKAILGMAMEAKDRGDEVVAYGKGMCGLIQAAETLDFFEIH